MITRALPVQKGLNSLKMNKRGMHFKGMRGKSDVIYWTLNYSNPKNSSSDSALLLLLLVCVCVCVCVFVRARAHIISVARY
jgi:hypothetical protein